MAQKRRNHFFNKQLLMKVGIVGLGLIGGSLGLDLRDRGATVLGISRQEKTCRRAKELGVVDEWSLSAELLNTADIVFICTPIDNIAEKLGHIIPHLRPETIVTDVGSVKTSVVEQCSRLIQDYSKKIYFVGGHPMAGTAEQGIEAAQRNLFKGAPYVFTPTKITHSNSLNILKELAKSLGSMVHECTPENHDRAVAWISHLPIMVSASLIQSCWQESNNEVLNLAIKLASSGFRDTSRVGGGNPELGLNLAKHNREFLLESLEKYHEQLRIIIKLITQENWDALEVLLQSTQKQRRTFHHNFYLNNQFPDNDT